MTYQEHATVPAYETVKNDDGTWAKPRPGFYIWAKEGEAPPAIGDSVLVTINNCGPAIVRGYFTQEGYLGLLVDLTAPPAWFVEQNKGATRGHVFGPEYRRSFVGSLETSETITARVDGFDITARLEPDTDAGAPWDNSDGHGDVTGWTTRAKAPGERVLNQDGRSFRYYDFAGAVARAKREGWGSEGDEGLTPGAKAARAAEADFKRLADWCADRWHYVGVVLTISRNGHDLDRWAASLWGIESDAGAYLDETALELVDEALAAGRAAVDAISA